MALLRAACESDSAAWHIAYGTLHWLSVLMLLPFDLNLIDSSLGAQAQPAQPAAVAAQPASVGGAVGLAAGPAAAGPAAPLGLIGSVVHLAQAQLASPGPSRDAAAAMLSRLLTRCGCAVCPRPGRAPFAPRFATSPGRASACGSARALPLAPSRPTRARTRPPARARCRRAAPLAPSARQAWHARAPRHVCALGGPGAR